MKYQSLSRRRVHPVYKFSYSAHISRGRMLSVIEVCASHGRLFQLAVWGIDYRMYGFDVFEQMIIRLLSDGYTPEQVESYFIKCGYPVELTYELLGVPFC